VQNFVSHLAQFLDNPSLGFGRFLHIPAGVLDNGEHAVYLGFQFRVFLQSFLQAGLMNDERFLDIRKTFCHGFSLSWIDPCLFMQCWRSSPNTWECPRDYLPAAWLAQNLTRTSNCTLQLPPEHAIASAATGFV
jgi:hypothetical protein